MHSNTNCFYGSSVSKRSLFEKPLFHSLMWTAILECKKIGCLKFDVGKKLYRNHTNNSNFSKKELRISDFKSGFGGQIEIALDIKLNF